MNKDNFVIDDNQKFEQKKDNKSTIKELLKFCKYYLTFKRSFIVIVLFLLINAILSIISPILSGKMIAQFSETMTAWPIIQYALIIVALSFAVYIVSYFIDILWSKISVNSTYLISKDLTYRINSIAQKNYDSAGTGTFTTRMYGDVEVVGSAPLKITDYIFEAITQIGFITYTLSLNVFVGLFVLIYVSINIWVEFKRINNRQKNFRAIKKEHETENSFRSENIRGLKDIRGLNATDIIAEKSLQNTAKRLGLELANSKQNAIYKVLSHILKTALDFAFICLCLYLFINGNIDFAAFLIIYNYRNRITGFSHYFVTIKDYLSECSLSAQRLNEIFDENLFQTEHFGDKEIEISTGKLEFRDVHFAYTPNLPVLKGISFVVQPNSITSLVGESGSGKSTIISLINKIYTLNENSGKIVIDNQDINTLTQNSLRNSICTISQSPYIFNMTIKENLLLANPLATDEQIIQALKKANIYDYVSSLPQQLNSKLGENGIKVSGGQKQRIAIARAILKNCKIILFDEATSALDNINQAIIKDTIKELSKDHTIIMIAHRLSTVIDSDKIIFVNDGKILQEGTHEQLMKNCKEYKKLYIQEENK